MGALCPSSCGGLGAGSLLEEGLRGGCPASTGEEEGTFSPSRYHGGVLCSNAMTLSQEEEEWREVLLAYAQQLGGGGDGGATFWREAENQHALEGACMCGYLAREEAGGGGGREAHMGGGRRRCNLLAMEEEPLPGEGGRRSVRYICMAPCASL